MGQQDKDEQQSSGSSNEDRQGGDNRGRDGHTGEGAASALANMISQDDRRRHQNGEADAGSGHPQ